MVQYNGDEKNKVFDENTRQWWIPDTGGANVPALNELLGEFGIALGDFVAEGYYTMGDHSMYYASGSTIVRFPKTNGSILIEADLHDQGLEILKTQEASQKVKKSVPILGLLQLNHDLHKLYAPSNNFQQNSFEENAIDQPDIESEAQQLTNDKNPILNKRTLLDTEIDKENKTNEHRMLKFDNNEIIKKLEKFDDLTNDVDMAHNLDTGLAEDESNENEQQILPKDEVPDPVNKIPAISTTNNEPKIKRAEGRIAIFGDSNCLDSTHLEKPCYWLLDALLEFTMNSHVSNLLRDLNKINQIQMPELKKPLPLRLPGSNLHQYSKVLDPNSPLKQRDIPKCVHMDWEQPIFLNLTAQHDLKQQNERIMSAVGANQQEDGEISANFLRKLESQKGEQF